WPRGRWRGRARAGAARCRWPWPPHSLASRRAPATPDVAADADPALAQAAGGGALSDDAAALVLGNDAAGAFCALGLRR
ncbi:hypothetical protein, partial [Chromobacterium vaccinii]|uniref:hypothetical protein n=1 Tax=Chromobacterium vaccinii TaxID=1108595 RepID=UPI00191055F3